DQDFGRIDFRRRQNVRLQHVRFSKPVDGGGAHRRRNADRASSMMAPVTVCGRHRSSTLALGRASTQPKQSSLSMHQRMLRWRQLTGVSLYDRVSSMSCCSHSMYGVPPVPRGSSTHLLMYSCAHPKCVSRNVAIASSTSLKASASERSRGDGRASTSAIN